MWIIKYIFMLLLFVGVAFGNQIESKIGQMVMVGFHGVSQDDEWTQKIAQQLKDEKIVGVVFYGYNIEGTEQFKELVEYLRDYDNKALYALDEEGGKVQRLVSSKGFENFPSAEYVADNLSIDEAYSLYTKIALELKKYGINYNFAPVVDLNVNPSSPAIGALHRSYSEDVEKVVEFSAEFIKAHKSKGVLTSLKHFPGHGSAMGDTHKGITDVTGLWSEIELEPFKRLIDKNLAESIMSAHIIDRRVDELPASLSKKWLDKLRVDMGYDGVIISDDLQMGAIAKEFSLEETVIKAINAGNDILLFSNYFNPDPDLPEKVTKIIKKALTEGRISKAQIEKSLKRIEGMM
ncbi:MAG: glycoside hydrolase family 3 N-terminal domain-containing protein [Campylobacterales bacterium]